MATPERVGRVRAGHEIRRPLARLRRRKRHVDMAEQPGRYSRRLERGGLHVEILPLGIEAQPRHVAVGDANLESGGVLGGRLRDPADRGLGTGFGRTGTGEEVHRLTLDVVRLHGRIHEQVDAGVGLGRPAKPPPDLRLGVGVVVVVAGHHDHGHAVKTPQHGRRLVDVAHLHPRAVEEVAGDHEEVGVSLVGDGHETAQGQKTLLDQATGHLGRILLEGQVEVVIGGVNDPNRHGVRRSCDRWGGLAFPTGRLSHSSASPASAGHRHRRNGS